MIQFLYNYYLTRLNIDKKNNISKRLEWYLYRYLKSALVIYYGHLSNKKIGIDENSNVVVSLTSFPARIHLVELAIKSILNQTYKPLKVILWLGKEKFPKKEEELPESLLNLTKKGLEIEFCEDLKPHTKYFYAFKKYPNNLIVTVDDDIFYPNKMLEKLSELYKKYPNCVIANRVREIKVTNGQFEVYRNWKINGIGHSNPSKKLLATGVGGVMYLPNMFKSCLLNVENLRRLAYITDDIWLKANGMNSQISVVFTNYFMKSFMEIPKSQKENLHALNVFEGNNDLQIKATFEYFGINENSFD